MNQRPQFNTAPSDAGKMTRRAASTLSVQLLTALGLSAMGVVAGLATAGSSLSTLNRIGVGVGLAAVFLAVELAAIWAICLCVTVRVQRDEARRSLSSVLVELEECKAAKAPKIQLSAAIEDLGDRKVEGFGSQVQPLMRRLYVAWITVTNLGETAEFAAHAKVTAKLRRWEDDLELDEHSVSEVAWENTLKRECRIPSRGSARLRLFETIKNPQIFWFNTAESAIWSPGRHGMGWRLKPKVPKVAITLEVVNISSSTVRQAEVLVDFSAPREPRIELFEREE